MEPVRFDDTLVRERTTEKVFPRALDLYEREQIVQRVRRDDVVDAAVWGSDVEPYRVRVRVADGGRGVGEVTCTCPYSFEGWCKHVGAVVLSLVEMPRSVEVRPALAETLAALDADALRALVLALADAHPALADEVEARAEGREPDPPPWEDEPW